MTDDKPQLQRQVRRARPYLFGLVLLVALFLVWRLSQPRVVIVRDDDRDAWPMGTFRTQNLIVEVNALVGNSINVTGSSSTRAVETIGLPNDVSDGTQLQTKNIKTSDTDLGIDIGLDTTINGSVRGGLYITRGAGGSYGANQKGLWTGPGATLGPDEAVGDLTVYNQEPSKSILFVSGGKGSAFQIAKFNSDQTTLFYGHMTVDSDITVITGTGQAALFSTKRAVSTDGFNVCIGGGCQSVAFSATSADGSTNSAFGIGALGALTIGNGNVAFGYNAAAVNTSGSLNSAFGANALVASTTSAYNTAIGNTAMAGMVDDVDNTCIGQACMQNISHGDGSVSIGVQSLQGGVAATTITHSVAIGLNAAQTVRTGAGQITAVGYQSLGAITTAVAPTALGAFALQACDTCTASTGLGASAGPNLTSGQYNTFVGGLAGGGITTGNYNTIVGAQVGGLAAGLSNNIIIADGQGNQRITADSSGGVHIPQTFDVVGLVGTTNQFHLGANGIQINSFSGTLVQPVIRSFAADPNGTVTGGIGSLVMDTSGPFLWQNTDGATGWQKIGGFTTGGSVYFGDATDGTCNFDGVATPVCGATLSGTTYTLARDTSPLNMAVSAGVTVRTDNWRLFIFNTLSGGGAGAQIINSGFDAVGRLPGNCGGINTRFYSACSGTGGAGANGGGTGNAGSPNTTSIPQFPTQAASAAGAAGAGHGQGGGGGTSGANVGGTGGAITICGPNCGIFTAVSGFTGKPDGNGTGFGLYGTGGGGGGCTGGSCEGGGGGGGGGILFVGANQCTGTILIKSAGGAGAAGALIGGANAGGGAGGGGGIVDFIYSHRSATCTTSIAGGTAGAGAGGAASGGTGSTGLAVTINLSGDGT